MEVPQKIKNTITTWSRSLTLGYISKRNEISILERCLHSRVHCTTIHNLGNNPNVHQWMHGFHKPWQIVAYEILYYGILFHCRKMKSWYNVSEFWKHAKWKKPEAKGHIWNDSISMKCSEQANPYR